LLRDRPQETGLADVGCFSLDVVIVVSIQLQQANELILQKQNNIRLNYIKNYVFSRHVVCGLVRLFCNAGTPKIPKWSHPKCSCSTHPWHLRSFSLANS
jgi:hypothetical protein